MSLHIILGPMYSGKTSMLISQNIIEKNNKRKPMIIDFKKSSDEDNNMIGYMENHDNQRVNNVYKIDFLMNYDILGIVENHDTILINEAQFFESLDKFVDYCLIRNKNVYLYGLDGDFQRKPMGHILSLIPKCDTVTKLNGMCYNCKINLSIFSHRTCDNKDQVLFDHNQYVPLCRKCYYLANSPNP